MHEDTGLGDVLAGPPLIYRRRVTWSDADAARIVYTVRFFEFAMAAAESWFREVWGMDWYRLHVNHGVGTPWVHIDMDIKHPLYPEDIIQVPVLISRRGNSSIRFDLRGRNQDGATCFEACYICALSRMEPDIRATPIPDDKRRVIDDYIRACQHYNSQDALSKA